MIVAQVRVAWQIQSRATLCSVRQLINSKAHDVTIEAAARQAPRKLARALTSWNRTHGSYPTANMVERALERPLQRPW